RLDAQAVWDGQRDRHDPRINQLPEPLDHELQQAWQVELADERRADLLQGLEMPRPRGRRLVEARVLDRDRRLRRVERDELLVVVVEVRAALLLGQVEVAVGDAAE